MSRKGMQKLVWLAVCAASSGALHAAPNDNLLAALERSKLSLVDGIRQVNQQAGAAISAKFEFNDQGKLSLSVYSAAKGLASMPEENVLQEFSGSPEQAQWRPEVEVFKDTPHIARSSEQLTLLSLSRVTLEELVGKAARAQSGKVFAITPAVRQHKPVAVVLLAQGAKVTELTYNLLDGALLSTRQP